MDCWILVFYPEPEGYNLLISANPCYNSKHIHASMIFFDSDMSKITNMVVYFDWKTVIYIYVCGKCHTPFMLPMEKSVTFTGTCVNEIIPSINRSFVYKAQEGRRVRICVVLWYSSKLLSRRCQRERELLRSFDPSSVCKLFTF